VPLYIIMIAPTHVLNADASAHEAVVESRVPASKHESKGQVNEPNVAQCSNTRQH
jgi:hypothetical protein